MKFRISIARRRAEVLRCQYFIAEIYNRRYGIMFSEDVHDIEARIEPYPQRYLMGTVDGELVATLGLYTHNTYIGRYGGITDQEVEERLVAAGVADQYAGATWRELTKLVVKDGWEGHGLTRHMMNAGYCRAFAEIDAERPVLIVVCGKTSLFKAMFAPRGRIRSSFLAPFPRYPVHAVYRSDQDPMESRLTIPAVDVPEDVRALDLPFTCELVEPAAARS